MQPLTLHIEGLHSFRKPASIDLADLGQHGLFGIFGPIGSGKSTILDAMTLALFGTVDRLVGRSKRGIVNHQSKRCEVRLRFRVGDEEWEAQRAYRADREGVAKRIHSRLAKLEGARLEVVADKEREVNAAIEALLGLNAEDFMRAVVLPQGRFMEFLHLQGTDRRRMLQRIFRLEPFGEGLRARVKREADAVDRKLAQATGELEGLGDAGAETVEQAKERTDTAREAAREARQAFSRASDSAESARRAVAHARALSAARAALAEHEAGAEDHADLKARIATARRIRPAREALKRRDDAEVARAAATARAGEAHTALEGARTALKAAQKEHQAARDARRHDWQPLASRREALTRAVGLLGDLEDAAARTHKLSHRRGQLRRRQEDEERATTEQERALEKIVARRTSLRNEWAETQVAPAFRERIRKAESAKRALDDARKRAGELTAELATVSTQLAEASEAVRRARGAVEAGEARLQRTHDETARLQEQIDALAPVRRAATEVRRQGLVERLAAASELARVSEDELEHARKDEAEARAEAERSEAAAISGERLAGVLAARLQPGQACQVCGSTEHPETAHPVSEKDLMERVAAQARAQAALEGRQRAREDADRRLAAAHTQLEALTGAIPEGLATRDVEALLLLLEREDKASGILEHAIARADRARRALAPGLDEARELYVTASARHAAIRDQHARLEVAQTETLDAEGQAWGTLTDALQGLTMFDLPRVAADIESKDRRRSELEPTLEAMEKELSQAQKAWEQRRNRLSTRRSELERVTAEHEAADARRESLLTAVREAAPDGEPVARLAEVDADLARLEQRVQSAETALETAREAASQAETIAAAADEAVRSASTHHEQALQSVRTALEAAEVEESAATAEAALEGQDLDVLQAQVERWFERRAALTHQLEGLEKVEMATIAPEELTAREEELAGAEARRRSAEADLVRASEQLAQLEKRAERYAALTREHADLTERALQLQTLARLLRGDRFVEFVANDYLHDLAELATKHLATLTRGRYALTLDDSGGFLIADLDAGGAVRPASSLSGGETFITSLALALALSTQVQRHNTRALEFFFLDEGFGSLDPESLDRVMTAIESLSDGRRVIGLISHVGAVRERVPRFLSLKCPRDGSGTQIEVQES